MANDLNRAEFIGRLGADPEVRRMPNGDAVANIRIAVGSSWKSKSGEKQESTEWIPVVFFGKLAEIVQQYLTKGSRIYVAGRFKTRKWQDKDGNERYSTEIVVDMNGAMQMLDSKPDGQAPRQQQPRMDAQNRASMNAQAPAPAAGGWGDDGDDIPFDACERGWVA